MQHFKERFGKECRLINESNLYKSSIKNTKYESMSITQLQLHHKHEALIILSYQFSSMGNTNNAATLMISSKDVHDYFSIALDHAIKTGFGCCGVDVYGHLIYVLLFYDYCDPPKYVPHLNKLIQYKHEMNEKALQSLASYRELIEDTPEFGEVICVDMGAARPDISASKLSGVVFFQMLAASARVGFKYAFSIATHPRSIQMISTIAKQYGSYLSFSTRTFSMKGFEFKDNVKLNDEYYSNLGMKYQFTDIKQLKTTKSTILPFTVDLSLVRKMTSKL